MSHTPFNNAMEHGNKMRLQPDSESTPGQAAVPSAIQVHNADPDAHDAAVPNLLLMYQTAKL